MANQPATPLVMPYHLEPDSDQYSTFDIPQRTQSLTVAHRQVEAYCYRDFPVSHVTLRFDITDPQQPLELPSDYPLNKLETVKDGHDTELTVTHSDTHLFYEGQWPSVVMVQYIGGMSILLYNAILRQSNVLLTRLDSAPEMLEPGITDLNPKYDPKFRSGLASDVKAMVGSYKDVSKMF